MPVEAVHVFDVSNCDHAAATSPAEIHRPIAPMSVGDQGGGEAGVGGDLVVGAGLFRGLEAVVGVVAEPKPANLAQASEAGAVASEKRRG